MLALGASQSINGGSTNAATVNCTIMGVSTDASIPPIAQVFQVLYQGQLGASVAALYTAGASAGALISAIHLFNTGGTVQTVTLAIDGTAGSNTIATIQIPANGWATYEDGQGWTVYSASGLIVGTAGSPGGVGTPATAAGSLTASQANLVSGSSIALNTNQLVVGSRYRWILGLNKTAAGIATWSAAVKFGVNNTTADAAIATWTSGTNTAAIDQAIMIIEMVVASLGASATANCIAMYVNRLTDVTGLGNITAAPGSTATFTSTAASPFLHVDVTPGASAVMTGWATAERLA